MAHLTALRRGGASIRRMANELGLSKTTVARLAKEQAALAANPAAVQASYRKPGLNEAAGAADAARAILAAPWASTTS